MRNLTYILAISLAMLIAIQANAQRDERRRTGDLPSEQQLVTDGLVYALPRTGFLITVELVKEDFVPGPYHPFAKKYLGIDNVATNASTRWTITGMNLSSYSEPDPKAYFKANDVLPLAISQLPNGIISGINIKGTEPEEQLVGGAFLAPFEKRTIPFADLSSDDFFDLIIETATGTERMVAKNNDEKAREAAEYIMRLRKKRTYKIINPSDVVPEDGEGYMAFIDEARRLDNEYVSLFIGKTFYSMQSYTFVYLPDEGNVRNDIVFRFADDKGILPKTDVSGKPIYININKDQEAFTAISKLKNSNNPNAEKQGIYYRIPAQASIQITDGLNSIYHGRATIAQMGAIVPLPANLIDADQQIIYNTTTGTIRSVQKK